MTIYRGPGGTGDATSDSDTTEFQQFLIQTVAAKDAAIVAQAAAELAENNAEAAEANVASDASAAATSATSAASSASAASTSATSAASSATAAATSASTASTQATNAASSASSASTSATAAASSATAAASSETNASNSAVTATTKASEASTSATNAAASASASAASATIATTQASSATASATAAAASYDSFDDRYLGSKTTDPSVDNDGSALLTGALYWNTVGSVMKVYTGTTWITFNPVNNPVDQSDIGTAPNEIPLNQYLGSLAYEDASDIAGNVGVGGALTVAGTTTLTGAATLAANPTLSGGTVNGVTYLNGSKVLTSGGALVFDGSNLGLGVTPNAWASVNKAIDISTRASLWAAESGSPVVSDNTYNNGTNLIYKVSAAAGYYYQTGGIHAWYNAPSGTAGNAITFTQAMTLNSSGNLGLGVTPSAWSLGKSIEIAVAGAGMLGNGNQLTISKNAYFNAGWKYARTGDNALQYDLNGGTHAWYVSPSGTAGNAITFTQAMTLDADGNLLVGKTAASPTVAGSDLSPLGVVSAVNTDAAGLSQCFFANRQSSDGTLILFRQANTTEGSISVAGTTVSYTGGHLARWAQTTTAKDESLLKGTVLSNLDEMNVYVDADGNPVDNEQLNKVKVSDVEGDADVAGVFVSWTYDEDHNVDEINMAMTGDMIIRIAQGTTVQRGDLLMSAGDGTAKPQGDDIVRSKTVAKVTSTYVTCTYADGSFCVPCVLMAC